MIAVVANTEPTVPQKRFVKTVGSFDRSESLSDVGISFTAKMNRGVAVMRICLDLGGHAVTESYMILEQRHLMEASVVMELDTTQPLKSAVVQNFMKSSPGVSDRQM